MNGLEAFFKENKKTKGNISMAVCKDLCNKEGKPISWQLKYITTEENEEIRQEALESSDGGYRLNVSKYLARVTAEAVVYPNLYDAKLQDSYGKRTPEGLLRAIVSCPAEYDALVSRVQEMNGFTSMSEDIERAKK